jgi:hypothetical protein
VIDEKFFQISMISLYSILSFSFREFIKKKLKHSLSLLSKIGNHFSGIFSFGSKPFEIKQIALFSLP